MLPPPIQRNYRSTQLRVLRLRFDILEFLLVRKMCVQVLSFLYDFCAMGAKDFL